MSRCFPYRLTLCARNGPSGEALIETIKLHCEKDKSKTESLKEKKRERKERRKERKHKEEKPYGFSDGKVEKLNDGKCCQEEKKKYLLGEHLSKKSEDELEKSSLTEEHDEPVCYLSDGIQSSNKRKRQSSPAIAPAIALTTPPSVTVHKNILRFRLPSLKHRETDASLSKEQSFPTVGRADDLHVQQVPDNGQCQITNKVEEASPVLNSSRKDKIDQFDASTGSASTLSNKRAIGTESFYKALIEDWVPPPFHAELNYSDDEDWLFATKQQSHEFKRLKAGNGVSCRQNSTLWPQALHLPEADIYALPYTMPF